MAPLRNPDLPEQEVAVPSGDAAVDEVGGTANTEPQEEVEDGDYHGKMADHYLALQAHHLALSDHFGSKDDKLAAQLHAGIAGHLLQMAELCDAMREDDDAEEGQLTEAPADLDARHHALAMGAASHLANTGYLTEDERDGIHKSARKNHKNAREVEKRKPKPFGSLSGAGGVNY